jgi:hypothetical protein
MTYPLLAQDPGAGTSMEDHSRKDGILVSAADFPQHGTADWHVTRTTLQGGVQEGVELIVLDNGKMKITLIPTRGMSIYRVECGDVTLGWNSPVRQIVHPRHIELNDHGGLGWLAGFNEMMVRCGVAFAGHPCEDDGKWLTLHGRIGNLPASDVSVTVDDAAPGRIRVRGKVQERMFKFGAFDLWTEVSTVPGSDTFRISDQLINQSEYGQEYQMIYHANYGRPLLEEQARFVAPVRSVAPFDEYAARDLDSWQTYRGPTRDYGEQVYCLQMNSNESGATTVMLQNAAADRGVAMRYEVASLPYFTLWKNTDTESDGYVTGLEPGTGFPYNRSVERQFGRVPRLDAGDEVRFQLDISVLQDAASVSATADEIRQIQGDRESDVSTSPPNLR